MEKITEGLDCKISGLLQAETITNDWNNKKLNQRELHDFDSKWVEEYKRINPREVDHEIKIDIDAIRKDVFLVVFRKTNSSDIASLASDDFELFISANHKKMESDFTAFLQSEYFNGRFPSVFLR